MTDVLCEVGSLRTKRAQGITHRLGRVADVVPHVTPRSLSDSFALIAKYGEQISSSDRDWTFPSAVHSIVCQYRELWRPVGSTGQEFKLENVQFQLLQHRGADKSLDEIAAFHWHPLLLVENREQRYNNRPHLHLTRAPEPLAKSHLAVALTVATEHDTTVEYLDQLLDEAIEMVAIEILERLRLKPLA